jgi:gliding motility-associated-like protein
MLIVLGTEDGELPSVDVCRGDVTQIGMPPSSNPNASYLWTPANGLSNTTVSNPYASPNSTTTYTLALTLGGCTSHFTQTVSVHYLDVQIPDEDTVVCGNTAIRLIINASSNDIIHYKWSLYPDFSLLLNSPNNPYITITPTQTTTYYWQVQTDYCTVSGAITVKISVRIEALDDLTICYGETGRLQLHYYAAGACTFQWYPEEGILSGANTASPMVSPAQSTRYTVIIIGENGCSDTADCYVTVLSRFLPDVIEAWADEYEIVAGSSVQLHATPLYGQNISYQWSPTTGLDNSTAINPIATPAQTTIYTVTISDVNGCTGTDTVQIRVYHLECDEPFVYIPNAFTPNGDGVNDLFRLRSKIVETMLLQVYDRWGELVFETTNIDDGWDGTFRGKPCDPGIYVFYVEAVCMNKQHFFKKGNVTLIK